MNSNVELSKKIEKLEFINLITLCVILRTVKTITMKEINNLENEINSLGDNSKDIVLEALNIIINLQEENIVDCQYIRENVLEYVRLKTMLT